MRLVHLPHALVCLLLCSAGPHDADAAVDSAPTTLHVDCDATSRRTHSTSGGGGGDGLVEERGTVDAPFRSVHAAQV